MISRAVVLTTIVLVGLATSAGAEPASPAQAAAVTATLRADKRLGAALNTYAAAVDQQQLATVPAGLPHDLLADRLALRRVQSIVAPLQANDDTSALAAAIASLATANDVLATTLGALSPPAEGDCAAYMHDADEMLGAARTQVRRAKAGDDPHQPDDFFHDLYPTAMSSLAMCQRLDSRAKF